MEAAVDTMSGVLEYLNLFLQLPRQQTTLSVDMVSPVFHEAFVSSGYRKPYKSWSYYLMSFFQLHNESINVWTHALAIILVLLQVSHLRAALDFNTHPDAGTIIAFTIGALTACVFSTLAHLLHSKSPWWHQVWFLLDYAGVTFYSFGTGLATYYIFSYNHSYFLQLVYIPFNIFMSWLAFTSCCFAKLSYKNEDLKRKLLMVFALGSQCFLDACTCLIRYFRCYYHENCELSSLFHMTIIIIMFIACAIAFSAHIPERWRPGAFDILGHGHQIFHICVIILMMLEYKAIHQELDLHSEHIPLSLSTVIASYAILFAMELVTLVSMKGMLRSKVKAATGCDKVE